MEKLRRVKITKTGENGRGIISHGWFHKWAATDGKKGMYAMVEFDNGNVSTADWWELDFLESPEVSATAERTRVYVERSATINKGNYESEKVTVGIELFSNPTPAEIAAVRNTITLATTIVEEDLLNKMNDVKSEKVKFKEFDLQHEIETNAYQRGLNETE